LRAWFVVLDWEDAIVMTSCLLQGSVHARTHAHAAFCCHESLFDIGRDWISDLGFALDSWTCAIILKRFRSLFVQKYWL
jgi:hypothetical protein